MDAAFLEEIRKWRKEFAQNIALRNKDLNLTIRDLNYAMQVIIDRIVFLRICEDRGIERYGQLQALVSGEGIYRRLRELFRRADERYNSGLFHFEEESGREDPDSLTLKLEIDDKILKEVLRGLYYPDSPYAFKFLPSEILGQVYEQFLGKIIRLTEGHQAKVEDKPEVKKAGGVFYTPTFIVDYNVLNTVGKVLEDKTPTQASDLRILDPACVSGSFLLGAYKYLLEWHSDWYSKHLAPLLDAGEKHLHDRMVALVDGMLALHKQLSTVRAGHERTAIQRQIEATDRQIDNLVYELYGLTEDEIKIVDEAISPSKNSADPDTVLR